ncbi:hypothetical protein SmphiM6_43 [Sinorhizobium phage phiM6]|nr:hypothetical protein SmphiM6_43 [Sinorhizobium phage phiM6]
MGSIMDQERPWERKKEKLNTIRSRIRHAAEFGNGSAISQIIDELERLEKMIGK